MTFYSVEVTWGFLSNGFLNYISFLLSGTKSSAVFERESWKKVVSYRGRKNELCSSCVYSRGIYFEQKLYNTICSCCYATFWRSFVLFTRVLTDEQPSDVRDCCEENGDKFLKFLDIVLRTEWTKERELFG